MKILVPYDFTPITRAALSHAFALGKILGEDIELLHIVAKESDKSKAENGFKDLLNSLSDEEQSKLTTRIRVGDIFRDITREAEEGGFELLVMGTHGAKGLQKIMGSKAIKVITSGNTPFVVTQTKGPTGVIKSIVMPVDLTKESAQIVRFATKLAKRFNAEVHIVFKSETDEWLDKKLKNNVSYMRNVLNSDGVKYVINSLPGKKSLAKEVIDYGTQHNADLFAIAHFSESILPQFDSFSQDIITNPLQLPVLIVNATPVSGVKGQYSFLTV